MTRFLPAFPRILPVALLGLLTACGQTPKTPLPGKRLSLNQHIQTFEADLNAEDIDIFLGDPETQDTWTHAHFDAKAHVPHSKFLGADDIAWTTNVGRGNHGHQSLTSGLVGQDETVFLRDADGSVYAVGAKDGQEKWAHSPSVSQTLSGGGIALSGEHLFVTHASGLVSCLDIKTGKVIWEQDLPYPLRSAPTLQHDNLYIITKTNKTICLSQKTGEVIWTHNDKEEPLSFIGGSGPTADKYVILSPYSVGDLAALHPRTGKELWRQTLLPKGDINSTSLITQITAAPVIDNGAVYAASHGDHFAKIDLRSGRVVWDKTFGSHHPPIVVEDFLFVLTSSNELICLTKGTGKIVWAHTLPTYADDHEKKGRLSWTAPRLVNGKIYVGGTNSEITVVAPQDGQVLDVVKAPGPLHADPIALGDHLLYLTNNGTLFALK